MITRTTQSTITFTKPFQVDGIEKSQPPGDYRVDVDEELLEGLSFLAYRRTAALLHLPAISKSQYGEQVVRLAPAEFDAMVQHDTATVGAVSPS